MMIVQPARFAATPSAVSAQYWRLLSSGAPYTGSGDRVYLYEIEMFSAADASGSDLTTGKTVSASSADAGNPASNAIDDNISVGWATLAGAATDAWVSVDFGSAVTVRSFTLRAMNTGANARISGTVLLQYSTNNSTWTTLATANPANAADGVKQTFTNAQ